MTRKNEDALHVTVTLTVTSTASATPDGTPDSPQAYPVGKLSPRGGWYNAPSHTSDEVLMAEKRRQLARWETVWRPEYDALIVRCIDTWGAAWIYQRKGLSEEISASLVT